jgi:hypothetical protein
MAPEHCGAVDLSAQPLFWTTASAEADHSVAATAVAAALAAGYRGCFATSVAGSFCTGERVHPARIVACTVGPPPHSRSRSFGRNNPRPRQRPTTPCRGSAEWPLASVADAASVR